MHVIGFGNGATQAAAAFIPRPNGTILFEEQTQQGAPGAESLRQVVANAQARIDNAFWNGRQWARVCGQPDGVPCDVGVPYAALSGLNDLGAPWDLNPFCTEFGRAMDSLTYAVAEYERVATSSGSPTYAAAKKRLDQEASTFLFFQRSDPWLPSTCLKRTSEINALVVALNGEIIQLGGSSAPVDQRGVPGVPTETTPWYVPVLIAGGVAIVGIIGVAVLTGNAANLVKAVKGRL